LTITDVLAARERRERMANARGGIAGGVDDDVDLGASISAKASPDTFVAAVFAAAANEGAPKRSEGHPMRERRRLGSRGIEVRDADDVNARRVLGLREIHRAKFARADQADLERTPFGGAGDEELVEIHGSILATLICAGVESTLT
jgi:hypothetical protein